MDFWTRIQQLPHDKLNQVNMIYGSHFPIEVRYVLSQWIHDQPWSSVDINSQSFQTDSKELFKSFMEELQSRSREEKNFVIQMKLQEALSSFMKNYVNNPGRLIHIIKCCLEQEEKIIREAENAAGAGNYQQLSSQMQVLTNSEQFQIDRNVDVLKRKTMDTDFELRKMIQMQENFVIQLQELQKFKDRCRQIACQPNKLANAEEVKRMLAEEKQREELVNREVSVLHQMRNAFVKELKASLAHLESLQNQVLDSELQKWKRFQQYPERDLAVQNIDKIQEWCEIISSNLWQNRQQIKAAYLRVCQLPLSEASAKTLLEVLNSLDLQIKHLLSTLISKSLVVEQQPPQVLKIGNRFSASARFLIGDTLTVHMTLPEVEVFIINESQAAAIFENGVAGNSATSGSLLNNSKPMEYNATTRQLGVSFRNMQVKKIIRNDKKTTECVTDEKFALLFKTVIPLGDGELCLPVWSISLAVTITVHCSQEHHAWATITWDNAFADMNRKPFAVPDKVPWSKMAEVLSWKFYEMTGKGLSESHLHYLAAKAFRGSHTQDYSSWYLSWPQFCKESIAPFSFTFWDWFYSTMKLTKDHLKDIWNENLIWGFVSRQQTEEALFNENVGTFILRFSDSELGGITVGYVAVDESNGSNEVLMISPFTHKDLTVRCLPDRLKDLSELLYLCPNTPKDAAFQKYYTKVPDAPHHTRNGYVPTHLKTTIPGRRDSSHLYGCASPHSPHSVADFSDYSSVQSPLHNPSVNSMPGTPSTCVYSNPNTPQHSIYGPATPANDYQDVSNASNMTSEDMEFVLSNQNEGNMSDQLAALTGLVNS